MKKIIFLLCVLVSVFGCKKQDYFEIPTNSDGTVYLTGVSSTTTTGISTLDGSFSVTATFATAKVGDVMNVELLQLQLPSNGGTAKQLLPMAGTQKTATVGSDMKATITYTRDEAKLVATGDYVTVVFNGATDYAKQRVDLVPATSASKPKISADKEIDVARTSEVANFYVTVAPKAATYAGTLVAKRKNGINSAWVTIPGTFTGTNSMVPISGDDFAAGKDTMFYSFAASAGTYTDEITQTIIVRDPYFFLKKSNTITLGGSSAGLNLIKNATVAENNANAMVAVSGDLTLEGGSVWVAAGKSIMFVPTTSLVYDANNLTNTKALYNAGVPTATADPIGGTGIYIYKVVNGPLASDVYYGMIKITTVVPGTSVSFEYRIGDQYAHLLVL